MTTFRVPTADELQAQLTGLGRLLTARKWERAAIVFAFTEVGEVGRGRWYKPEPPRMHIREFAAQGFAGLTTNKAVTRYRDAWVSAVSNGWTTIAEPGKTVQIPEQPFPEWPYGGNVTFTETDELTEQRWENEDEHREWRPAHERLWTHLTRTAKALESVSDEDFAELDDEQRQEFIRQLTSLQRLAREIAKQLRGRHLHSV